jgi:hypothetical protein
MKEAVLKGEARLKKLNQEKAEPGIKPIPTAELVATTAT